MNVYDCANELAKALKESHEFKKLQEARVVLKKDAQAEELANDFIKLSSEIELAKYQKQEVDKEKEEKLQSKKAEKEARKQERREKRQAWLDGVKEKWHAWVEKIKEKWHAFLAKFKKEE